MNKCKSSKKLNALYDELMNKLELLDNNNDILVDLYEDSWKVCTEQTNDYRAIDYAEYIESGIDAVYKSIKTGKPIYCVSSNKNDDILYYVENLDTLISMYKKYIARVDAKLQNNDIEIVTFKKEKI